MEWRLTTKEIGAESVIRVDGRLAGAAVAELERACLEARRPLRLDLTHLVALDDSGVAALRRLAADGIELAHASPYVVLLVRGATPEREEPGTRRTRRTRRK